MADLRRTTFAGLMIGLTVLATNACSAAPKPMRAWVQTAAQELDKESPGHAKVVSWDWKDVPPPAGPGTTTGSSFDVTLILGDGSQVVVPVICSPVETCVLRTLTWTRTGP